MNLHVFICLRSGLIGLITVLLFSGTACSSAASLAGDDHHDAPGEPLSVEKLADGQVHAYIIG